VHSREIDDARRDMLEWSAPVVNDIITDSYLRFLGAEHASSRILCSIHARLWRTILQGDMTKLVAVRKDLTALSRLAGISRATFDSIDQAVLNELLDVITARYVRSPTLVRIYSRFLLTASANLAEMRLAAV
jgi:hypothetical protein